MNKFRDSYSRQHVNGGCIVSYILTVHTREDQSPYNLFIVANIKQVICFRLRDRLKEYKWPMAWAAIKLDQHFDPSEWDERVIFNEMFVPRVTAQIVLHWRRRFLRVEKTFRCWAHPSACCLSKFHQTNGASCGIIDLHEKMVDISRVPQPSGAGARATCRHRRRMKRNEQRATCEKKTCDSTTRDLCLSSSPCRRPRRITLWPLRYFLFFRTPYT